MKNTIPSNAATLSRLLRHNIWLTFVHVFVFGSYLSTLASELWAAPSNVNKKVIRREIDTESLHRLKLETSENE